MVQHAQGLFIWAATACKFIRDERHLDVIYTTVLYASISGTYSREEQKEAYDYLRLILGSIVVLFSELSVEALSKLLNLPSEDISDTIAELHSILDIPEELSRPLRLHHDAFRGFLLDATRCKDHEMIVNEQQAHLKLAKGCLEVMSSVLKEDVCDQGMPGVLVSDVDSSHIQECLPLEAQYACLYWVRHLSKSECELCDNGYIHHFLRSHVLHWTEAMSWMGKTTKAIEAIALLELMVEDERCQVIRNLVHDCKRFLMYARSGIEQAPLQTYVSAVLFTPSRSVVRKIVGDTKLVSCVGRSSPMLEHWSALLLTLEGHLERVTTVQFSPDGSKLASGSEDGDVIVWDLTTGAKLHTLEGHSDCITTMQFSPNGSRLASAYEGNVAIWDVATGAQLHTMEVDSVWATVVEFSPNGGKLASGSDNGNVIVWDLATGAQLNLLEGHSDWVRAIQFSPDGSKLASVSDDGKVILWDATMGAQVYTLEGHSDWVRAVQFSPDGSKLASV
ncbi:hypothetical protein MBLNU13_g01183t2 [Cladosporium sp. NU13]